jgi:excisionase family DNA binding protein
MRKRITTQTELEAAVRVTADGCWLLPPVRPHGYAGAGGMPAHRFAWILATGERPPRQLHVCHTCDMTNCVRNDGPRTTYTVNGRRLACHGHLFLGTALDNQQDSRVKRRGGISGRPTDLYALALAAYNSAEQIPVRSETLSRLLTLREAAERLRVSPKTVGRIIDAGELAVIAVGSRYRIDDDALQAYIEAHTHTVGVDPDPGATSRSPDPGPRAGARPRPSAPTDSQPAGAISSPNPSHRKRA